MEGKYIEILLVNDTDGETVLVTVSGNVEVGDIVEFDGGTLGRVITKAWVGEENNDTHNMFLLTSKYPVYAAEKYWNMGWQGDVSNVDAS